MKASDATQTKPHNHCRRNRTSLCSRVTCHLLCLHVSAGTGGRGTFCTCVLSHDTQLNHCLNVHVTRERPTHCWCANVCDASKQIRPRESRLTRSSDAVGRDMNQLLLTLGSHVESPFNRKFCFNSENL